MLKAIGLGVAALMLATGLGGQAPAPDVLSIDGTSTLRKWTCDAEQVAVEVEPATGYETGVMAGEKSITRVTITVPVQAIDCNNATMDGHLRKALKADDHPTVEYELLAYELECEENDTVSVHTTGTLTIAGESRPTEMAVIVTRGEDGRLRVKGEQKIEMTEFGVKPPTLMLGTLKVGDAVTVRFDVTL